MRHRRKLLVISGASLALVAGGLGAAYAVAGGGDDGEGTATGPDADKARAAALAANPGAKANAVERDDEKGATWEVELTRADGKTVDVRLDENYKIVMTESDSESESGDAGE